jgi:small subunit ribosomal protein S6
MRTYELAIVADPRLSDEEHTTLVDETKQLIATRGGELVREESWGKRKLAYPIEKLTEGRYSFLYLQMPSEKAKLFDEVELRLRQNDKVLRFITVRTDLDIARATGRLKPGQTFKAIHSDLPAVEPAARPVVEAVEPAEAGEEE